LVQRLWHCHGLVAGFVGASQIHVMGHLMSEVGANGGLNPKIFRAVNGKTPSKHEESTH